MVLIEPWTTKEYVEAFLERYAICIDGGENDDSAREVATQSVFKLATDRGDSPGAVLAKAINRL